MPQASLKSGYGKLLASVFGLLAFAVTSSHGQTASTAKSSACSGDNGGLTLPSGFCATIFADQIGHARQLAIAPDGTVYVNTWSGRYYRNETPHPGGSLVALKDTKGSGRADVDERFGETFAEGGHGGTGIAYYNGAIYAEINDRIVRYPLKAGEVVPNVKPDTIVSGLPLDGDHPMHPFTIDSNGNLFVDLGSASNACQAKNRMLQSPGRNPCVELETRGGTWRYDANKTGQLFSPKERYATGIRNGEGFDFDVEGRLFVTQHGRDQLRENWPELYTPEQGAELPAEEVVLLREGGDYGWPYCYYDQEQRKLVLAPEYGGDGGKTVGLCAEKLPPAFAFPGHWAPNDLKIYKGTLFPQAYRGGAFIAFHGSWNRAPFPQQGYFVVFQPLANGAPSGQFSVFADGFAGTVKDRDKAEHRPSGLAIGPDGALYISDDVGGRIWRITYTGSPDKAGLENAPASKSERQGAGLDLPTPPGAKPDEVVLGGKIFRGEIGSATCSGCHGADATGTPVGPNLSTGKWLWSDGSLASLTERIAEGVPEPKLYRGPMPPLGGSQLSPDNLKAVAAYVWAVGHQKK